MGRRQKAHNVDVHVGEEVLGHWYGLDDRVVMTLCLVGLAFKTFPGPGGKAIVHPIPGEKCSDQVVGGPVNAVEYLAADLRGDHLAGLAMRHCRGEEGHQLGLRVKSDRWSRGSTARRMWMFGEADHRANSSPRAE